MIAQYVADLAEVLMQLDNLDGDTAVSKASDIVAKMSARGWHFEENAPTQPTGGEA